MIGIKRAFQTAKKRKQPHEVAWKAVSKVSSGTAWFKRSHWHTSKERRSELDDSEVEEPVGDGRDCVGVGSSAKRVDFRRVEPGEFEPGWSEEEEEEEETEYSALGSFRSSGNETTVKKMKNEKG